MVLTRLGLYLNIEVPGKAMFAKMLVDGSEFLEVATLGSMIFVNFGTCK